MRATSILGVLSVCGLLAHGCAGSTSKTQPSPPTAATVTVAATPPSTQHGYLESGDSGAVFVQWTDDNGSLVGQVQLLNSATQSHPERQSLSFTGVRSGDHLSLRFADAATWTGTLQADTLTLVAPSAAGDGRLVTLVLRPGSVTQYNEAVSAFERAQSVAATATAIDAARAAAVVATTATAEAMDAATVKRVPFTTDGTGCFPPFEAYKYLQGATWSYTLACVDLRHVGGRFLAHVDASGGCLAPMVLMVPDPDRPAVAGLPPLCVLLN